MEATAARADWADIRKRRAEALRLRESGLGVDEIREAMGYRDNRLVRSDIRKAREPVRLKPVPHTASVKRRPHPLRKHEDIDEELPVDILTSRNRRVHRMIEQHARRRHERLEGLLRASGLHVSQMTPQQLGSRVWSLEQYDG